MPPPWGPPPGTPGLQGLCGCFDFPYRPCEFSFFFPLQSYKYLKESQVCFICAMLLLPPLRELLWPIIWRRARWSILK
ncbi:hypothetical protein CIPAW_08G177400 [Carya illinoinensis]|uniref:Uncharacterized protein n=1 Tax=Carya illinoinensis TaxID=32201 RepID=A0A8T1PXR3_CARIL|nr:hypothetical protein CIPAW_08G177400 [Carya illinoinensis]